MQNNDPKRNELKYQNEIAELKRQVIELQDVKKQFELLTQNIDFFIWLMNERLEFTYVSPSVVRLLGFDEQVFLKGTFLDYCTPASQFIIKEAFSNRLRGISDDAQKCWEIELVHKAGHGVWLENFTKPLFDSVGSFIGVVGIARDITKRKKDEKNKLANELYLIAQIENTQDAIFSVDLDLKILTINKIAIANHYKIFGVRLNIGDIIIKGLDTSTIDYWKSLYKRCFNDEAYIINVDTFFEGMEHHLEVSFNPIKIDEKVIGASCYARDITQLVNSQKALIESEQRFKSLISNLPSVAFRCKVDEFWTMEFISDEVSNLTGYLPDDFINNKVIAFADIIYFEDKNLVYQKVFEAIKNNASYHVDYRITHKNGNLVWVHERGKGIYKNDGSVLWLDGLISNIHDQKSIQQSLLSSEEKFRSIFEYSVSSISIQSKDKIVLVNKAWEETTGYTAEEALIIDPFQIIHPQMREEVKVMFKNRFTNAEVHKNIHILILTKDRQEKWISITSSLIKFDGQDASLLFGVDITEQKIKELQIRKLTAGIINSPSSIVITDIDGNIEYVNPFFCEFNGYTYEEVIGQNPRILNSGKNSPELFKNLWSTILGGNIWTGEIENKKKNGELYWESARIAPITDDDGVIINFVAVKEDITEQKTYQVRIEQSERDLRDLNAKKDKFFSIIAHDLRSPFVGLVGLTDLLKDNYKELSEEKLAYYLKYASEASHNVFKLLENLLEWSRSQTGKIEFKPERIVLTELIQDAFGVLNIFANQKEINLVNYAYANTELLADKNMVFTILRNLISNAVKYTPRGGRIEIDAAVNNNFATISVKDSGVGIPEDKQKRLFKIEENYTTPGTEKEKGSGLGLILCKEFVEKHNGRIWCQSTEGNGSIFYFTLPLYIR